MESDLLELMRSRRSIRAFRRDRAPSEDQIRQLLEAARWAPSGGNVQPCRFYVIRDAGLQSRLAAAALQQTFIAQAPLVIAVCVDLPEAESRYGTRGRELYCLQDSAAATQNILLLAHSMGLATCWVGAFSEDEVARALELPGTLRPVALIPVGYPDETPAPPPRKRPEEIVRKVG